MVNDPSNTVMAATEMDRLYRHSLFFKGYFLKAKNHTIRANGQQGVDAVKILGK